MKVLLKKLYNLETSHGNRYSSGTEFIVDLSKEDERISLLNTITKEKNTSWKVEALSTKRDKLFCDYCLYEIMPYSESYKRLIHGETYNYCKLACLCASEGMA